MIVITGASGHLGSAIIDFLLDKGVPASNLLAFIRDAAKADGLKSKGVQVKIGSYDDYPSMVAAFQQADQLLLISGTDIPNRSRQQADAVKAAKEAGVKHILYTSFLRKNDTGTSPIEFIGRSHRETESHIKASGIPYTILKNGLYADALPMFLGEKVFETGIFLSAGQGKAAYTTRLDMAEAIANILTGTGHQNKEYVLATAELSDLNQVATLLSEIAGRAVPYVDPSVNVYSETLTKAGVPAEFVGMLTGFSEAIRQGEFATEASDLETLLGRKPTTLKTYLESVFSPKPSYQS